MINSSALTGMLVAAGTLGALNQLWPLPAAAASALYDVPMLGEARLGVAALGAICNAFAKSKCPCKAGQEQLCFAVGQSGMGGHDHPPSKLRSFSIVPGVVACKQGRY